MSNKTNLKPVDESFVNDFFGGIQTGDDSFSQAPEEVVDDTSGKEEPEKKTVLSGDDQFSIGDLISEDEGNSITDVTFTQTTNTAKPKSTTSPINNQIKDLIEEGVLFGFDDDDFEIKSTDELKELIVANKEEWKRQVMEEEYEKDFQALPYEMQYAVEYIKKGGTDMKGLFKALSQTQETLELDPEKNPKEVTKAYLEATSFGTYEEIQEQLDEWEDLSLLEKKAKVFKPKLEKISEDRIKAKLKEQEEITEKQTELAQKYYNGIKETLKEKKINDLTIDAKEQDSIYKALTENSYVSSRNGAPMNYLGKFLEDITWNKPDYALMAELALWAKDPKAFKDKIKKQVKEEVVAETERVLRTNRQNIKSQELDGGTPKTTLGRKGVNTLGSGLLKR